MYNIIEKTLNQLKTTFRNDLQKTGLYKNLDSKSNPFKSKVIKIFEEEAEMVYGFTKKIEKALEILERKKIRCKAENCNGCLEEDEETKDQLDEYCNTIVKKLKDWIEGFHQGSIYSVQELGELDDRLSFVNFVPFKQKEKAPFKEAYEEATKNGDTYLDNINNHSNLVALNVLYARSLIAEAVLNKDREVISFRKKYLNGNLFANADEAYEFLKTNEYKKGDPNCIGFEYIKFVKPKEEWVELILVKNCKNKDLGKDLKYLTNRLKPLWGEPRAVLFILTGAAGGPLRFSEINLNISASSDIPEPLLRLQSEFITLRLSTVLPSSYAKLAFNTAKKQLFELDNKRLKRAVPGNEKLLWLSVFVAQELSQKKRSWSWLMKEWNERYIKELSKKIPEKRHEIEKWSFSSEKVFANKARKALCQLLASSWREVRSMLDGS